MNIGDLYSFVLLVILVGMLLGIGVVVLDNFAAASGVSTAGATAINNTRDAITPIASTWLPLIVTVAVLSIVLVLVIKSFGAQR